MSRCGHGRLYRWLRACVRLLTRCRRYRVIRCGNDRDAAPEPVVYVSRHHNLFGPWMTMLWFPDCFRVWVYHVFLEPQAAYRHYVDFTFTKRFGWNKHWAKVIAGPVSYAVAMLLRSAACIPVYRQSKQIGHTFRQTVQALMDGVPVFIFPDVAYQDASAETGALYKGFLHLEKYVYRATGQHVRFVPVYVSRRQRAFFIGDAVRFRDGEPFHTERDVVYQKIRDGLNRLAVRAGELDMKLARHDGCHGPTQEL